MGSLFVRFSCAFLIGLGILGAGTSPVVHADSKGPRGKRQEAPFPLPDHPGNVFLLGERVKVAVPPAEIREDNPWELRDDQRRLVAVGKLRPGSNPASLEFPDLGVGWYRLEFGGGGKTNATWTTLAVLAPLQRPVPAESPIGCDSATAWFARADTNQQARLANLAALAGVSWVRDRLRWSDLQPSAGKLVATNTTYDTSARIESGSGLQVLQVFHDTPQWAREGEAGGRFAPDLRTVYAFAKNLAKRFRGTVQAWEPWNEGNVASFGGHTVDQMCSWQKAAYLGFKAGDPKLTVGWNASAAVPTPAQTRGILANETWPYFDTYNIHTYDWAHGYADLWAPAREAASGKPLWITEADRGTPHLKQAPFFDQDPHLEILKAQYMGQSYASSLFAGASRHFHFILGHYHEPNGVQFGLLRIDLTPRPAYVALAAVARSLANARPLGRWRPGNDVQVYAFRAAPNGQERDVLVVWAEKEVDWDHRGRMSVEWTLPDKVTPLEVIDYLGRSLGKTLPTRITGAPIFVLLPTGQASWLPMDMPPSPAAPRPGKASPLVLQLRLPAADSVRVEDLPWSEGYAYRLQPGETMQPTLFAYNFGRKPAKVSLKTLEAPSGWKVYWGAPDFTLPPGDRHAVRGTLEISSSSTAQDGWVIVRAECGGVGDATLAFRVLHSAEKRK